MHEKPLLIVGLDPGTTAAYALLDLQGNVIDINSAKHFNLSTIIFQIIEQGIPVITATDVVPIPSFVHEFHRKTGTQLVVPDQDMSVLEKRALTKDMRMKNKHERDALAAARYAFRTRRSLLRRIDSFLRKRDKADLAWQMKKIVLTKKLCPEAVFQLLNRT